MRTGKHRPQAEDQDAVALGHAEDAQCGEGEEEAVYGARVVDED